MFLINKVRKGCFMSGNFSVFKTQRELWDPKKARKVLSSLRNARSCVCIEGRVIILLPLRERSSITQ